MFSPILMTGGFFVYLGQVLKMLTLGTTSGSRWTTFLGIWVIRLVSFSLLFRTYIGPWILARMSGRITVRSVSLRSIRGIYIRMGTRTLHVDRIGVSYRRAGVEVTSRLSIKIEGLRMEVGEEDIVSVPQPKSRPRRGTLTLRDLSPSPIALGLWSLVSTVYAFLDPYLRPLIRTVFVAGFRVLIRCLPALTQHLDFELNHGIVTFVALPGLRMVVNEAFLHTEVAFTQLEDVIPSDEEEMKPTHYGRGMSLSMAAWKSRFSKSIGRTWDRAWGKTKGSLSFSLKVKDIKGLSASSRDSAGNVRSAAFFDLPGTISLISSVSFNPKRGSLEPHSVVTALIVDPVYVDLDSAHALLRKWKRNVSPDTPRFSEFADNVGVISPVTPMSPFMEALSSIRSPRITRRSPRSSKLPDSSKISPLMTIDIRISTIRLSHNLKSPSLLIHNYEMVIHDVSIGAKLSDADQNSLHREKFGRNDMAEVSSDVYAFTFSVDSTALNRSENVHPDPLRILSIGPIGLEVLVSQWPSPWLEATPYMSGDPNAPLLVTRVNISSIEVTEQLEFLQSLLDRSKLAAQPADMSPRTPYTPFSLPRLDLYLRCGTVRGTLICVDRRGEKESSSVEVRTDGFRLSVHSYFLSPPSSIYRNNPFADRLPVQMQFVIGFTLHPTFVRVRSSSPTKLGSQRFSKIGTPESDLWGDTLISLEAIEIKGEGMALGEFNDDTDVMVMLDIPSAFLDLHCASEALSVELWHPNVITAAFHILSLVQNNPPQPTSSAAVRTSLLDRLPFGLSASLSIARLTLLSAGRDLNPTDDQELSRGVALRTGVQVQYSALRPGQVHYFKGMHIKSEVRHKLYLSEDRLVEALSAAKVSAVAQSTSAFFQVALWDTALRSAVTTQYVADDPYMAERDDPIFKAKEFLRIRRGKANIRLTGKHGTESEADDACNVAIDIPEIQGTFRIAHVYSVLLALRTIAALSSRQVFDNGSSTRMLSSFKGVVKTIQILWDLPDQSFVTRINSLGADITSAQPYSVRWTDVFLWVPVPSQVDQWEEGSEKKWQELGHLQQFGIYIPRHSDTVLSVSVEGDSARLRIPYGYILADLILAVNLTVKSLSHLKQMVDAGQHSEMPWPEPEGPKSMPNISVRVRFLALEASDDDMESKLGLNWRLGLEASKRRLDREEAFRIKVATIRASDFSQSPSQELDSDYQFSSNHSVSIEEARERLSQVHAMDWIMRHRTGKDDMSKQEEAILERINGRYAKQAGAGVPNLVAVQPIGHVPPLFRAVFCDLRLNATQPSFPLHFLPDFLFEQGGGLPRNTQFSLLLPMHLNFSLSSLRITLRDYPIPLLDIPPNDDKKSAAFVFDTDLVVAEEMGTTQSVDWVECNVIDSRIDIPGSIMSVRVPKTIMPVKSYASPDIRVTTNGVTAFSWNVSYGPAIQDVMRVIETLSHSPRDSSPSLGFWDKIRLVFHWKFTFSFKDEVRLRMKGSRDPYHLTGDGAGFALCCQGNPKLIIGHKNEDKELIQVISDTMLIVIPNLEEQNSGSTTPPQSTTSRDFRKICAKFTSGVRFGVGFVLERSCGPECRNCLGSAFDRRCRFFDIVPHYHICYEKKSKPPALKTAEDSYNGFRSDFIHLSISLTSSMRGTFMPGARASPSSLHLTPKAFAHFWSWWDLFDGIPSLPVRQGSYYNPPRNISPKFGRHLATIKWRLCVSQLFISHAYIDDSRDSWIDGVTPFVGVKAMIDHFQADLHQRDQESIVPGSTPDTIKVTRHKPFYAAEVVLKGLDLRAMLAVFTDTLKQSVPVTSLPDSSNYRTRNKMPFIPLSSPWINLDDFVECDWSPSTSPAVHLLPAVHCPHFTYFKRNPSSTTSAMQSSKFGGEDTHVCHLGKEASVPQIQVRLISSRIDELQKILRDHNVSHSSISTDSASEDANTKSSQDLSGLTKMVSLLEDYVAHLREVDVPSDAQGSNNDQSYYMPSDSVSPDEWAEFENVYQVHCPKIFIDNAIRDVMMQYYYCSRARRGFEYHLATRAVKFIRDQAAVALATDLHDIEKPRGSAASSAQAAATALRKMLGGDLGLRTSVDVSRDLPSQATGTVDPLNGWSDGVSLSKSHFCLLLKPQLVLRCEASVDSICVLAAVQAKLQSFAIMDDSNLEDPVCGKVMSRSYTSLNGLQAFSPANSSLTPDGCVPLEVLLDYRCESSDFDRLVPQTDATFHYDKFNRLRLRNNVTSVMRTSADQSLRVHDNHLQNQTDLIQVHIPRFTVSASDQHFQAISNIVTKLILFSDPAHKNRKAKLDTLLITYDFTDLISAAEVVANLQSHLRGAIEMQRAAELRLAGAADTRGRLELLKLEAHIFLLTDELNYIFDAIKLAQDRTDDHTDQKSAVLLHASSSEISWQMLDDQRDLLAKLAVREIDYYWLSRQDSSTVNNLTVGDLQAFDGSPHAVWDEILSKYFEPANHPLCKRELFIVAAWTVLAPVGGITIYQNFQLDLHPMRLQLDARVGARIMEYVWPARKDRHQNIEGDNGSSLRTNTTDDVSSSNSQLHSRSSLDSPRPQSSSSRKSLDSNRLAPPLRRLGTSRSFTDLRSAKTEQSLIIPKLGTASSSKGSTRIPSASSEISEHQLTKRRREVETKAKPGDAAEMRTRSSQKTFVHVKISSLHLLLSILKEESFECTDARIRTRDLEYRNQTWSFEELVDQFIPSGTSWTGWVKMAFNQPLVPVFPVARELISKTKWITSKGSSHVEGRVNSVKLLQANPVENEALSSQPQTRKQSRTSSPHRRWRKTSRRKLEPPPSSFTSAPLTNEPESFENSDAPYEVHSDPSRQPRSRSRVMSLFTRGSSKSRTSTESSQATITSMSPRRQSGEGRDSGGSGSILHPGQ